MSNYAGYNSDSDGNTNRGEGIQSALLNHRYRMPKLKQGFTHCSNAVKDVFSRTYDNPNAPEIPDGLYNLIIGMVLCWGFGVNWLILKLIPLTAIIPQSSYGKMRLLKCKAGKVKYSGNLYVFGQNAGTGRFI